MNDKITKAVEQDIKQLDEYKVTYTKQEILDLIQILSKEYEQAGNLLTKLTDSIRVI